MELCCSQIDFLHGSRRKFLLSLSNFVNFNYCFSKEGSCNGVLPAGRTMTECTTIFPICFRLFLLFVCDEISGAFTGS